MLLIARLGIALLLAAGSGCSSSKGHRDRNYGTDAGAGYQLPDGGARDSALDAASEVRPDATPEAGSDRTPENSQDLGSEPGQDGSPGPDGAADGANSTFASGGEIAGGARPVEVPAY
jgi:hypothetical protein